MSFAKPIFTTRGKQIELQGIEGQQIIFTKIKIGDGKITTQTPSQLKDLIHVIAEAPITGLKRYDAYAAIRSVFQNVDVQEAFYWREVGLYAIDPATKEEVLYAYQNAYDTAEYVSPSSLVTKKINWIIYIDDGENLGADIHKNMIMATTEDIDDAIDKHNADVKAHVDLMAAHNADEKAHENKFNELKKQHDADKTECENKFNEFKNKYDTDKAEYENKISELKQSTAGTYLPLAGGSMTERMAMCRNESNSDIYICGGKTAETGAYFQAYGAENNEAGGQFLAAAVKDNDKASLVGKPDGTLLWKDTVLSDNEGCAVFPKAITAGSGGTAISIDGRSGTITQSIGNFLKTVDNTKWLRLYGGTNDSDGASILLYGGANAEAQGRFVIFANNGEEQKVLHGDTNGTLQWDDKDVVVAGSTAEISITGNAATATSISDTKLTFSNGTQIWVE